MKSLTFPFASNLEGVDPFYINVVWKLYHEFICTTRDIHCLFHSSNEGVSVIKYLCCQIRNFIINNQAPDRAILGKTRYFMLKPSRQNHLISCIRVWP